MNVPKPEVNAKLLEYTKDELDNISLLAAYLLPVSTEVRITLKMSRETGSVYATIDNEFSGI